MGSNPSRPTTDKREMNIMKKLFILVSDGGDGSYYPHYTFNEDWIKAREEQYRNGELDCQSAGCDGDGFHYDVLMVSDDTTYESLGISKYRVIK